MTYHAAAVFMGNEIEGASEDISDAIEKVRLAILQVVKILGNKGTLGDLEITVHDDDGVVVQRVMWETGGRKRIRLLPVYHNKAAVESHQNEEAA